MKVLYVGQLQPLKDGIADHNSNYIRNLSLIPNLKITCLHNQEKISKVKNVRYVKFNIFSYRKLIKEFDVVHFQFGASYYGDFVNLCFLLTPKKKKIVSTLHDFSNFTLSKYYRIIKENPQLLPYSIFNCSIKYILRESDKAIVYSNFFKNRILDKYPQFRETIKVILHGVDVYQDKTKKAKSLKVLKICSFGGITPRKGLEEPIKAVKKLQKEGYSVSYDIYGHSPFAFYTKELKELIGDSSVSILGSLNGESEDIIKKLRQYDLLIIPRKYTNEGASGSLTFSMASLVPVITVNGGSFREYIQNGKTGFLVNHSSSEYHRIIKEIIENKHKLDGIISNTAKWIKENIAWKVVCKKHEEVYKKC